MGNLSNNIRIIIISVFITVWCVPALKSEPTSYSYNSSDLSYLSNEEIFQDSAPEVEWLRDLYDHLKWHRYLRVLNNTQCRDDIATYIRELLNGTSWATKMYDASGRYNGQFFFGNDYWLGSKSLCYELEKTATNPVVPPFPVYFFVARVRIYINRQLTPITRQLNIGQCLPSSCNLNDVRMLLAQESKRDGQQLNIVGVRPVPGKYSVWKDVKFQIIGGVSAIIFVLTFIASLVEYILKDNKSKAKSSDAKIENNNNNDDDETKNSKERKGMDESKRRDSKLCDLPLKLLLCFSAITNGKKILNVQKINKNSITCIHGLRFFSIAWIIMVHTYLELFAIADNKNLRILTERTFMYQTVSNATFSVDTFFFISGLLVTITYFRAAAGKTAKKENSFQVVRSNFVKFLMLIIYRFFRLTPAYLLVLGFNEIVMRYLHDYSVFSPAIIDHISCSNFWWRNALYINNFYPQTEFCMIWSWYISNDTQFYVIAAVLMLIAVRGDKHVKFAGAAVGIFLVSSWIITFIIAMKYDYVIRVQEPFALFDQLYDKPWMRIGPYLIGMIAGYFLFRVDCKITLSPIAIIMGWTLSLLCLGSLVYGVGAEGLMVPTSAFYASLGHTAWGLALAWITVACCSGYGGPLSSLFSFRLFLPLSRLTYCAYLVHPVLMCLTSFILDGPVHLHQTFVIVIYCGNIIFSFICAFAISLGFEAPVVNLLKILF